MLLSRGRDPEDSVVLHARLQRNTVSIVYWD